MADKVVNKKQALLDNSVVENLIENQLIDFMHELPDPDIILRKANIDQDVYREILADAHVIGEVRPLRSGLLSYKYEIKAGDDSALAQKALDVCKDMFNRRPHSTMSWADLNWSIGKAPLVGRRVHHVQWMKKGPYVVPESIFDISTLSYAFNHDGNLLIRTIEKPEGELAEDYRWLVTRHMAERENPYGLALLSTCFWPWMFKNGGLKFFVKFCEKFGVPWPMAQYPQGTQKEEISELVERLQDMVEDAVGAVPEGTKVDLLEAKSTGESPQERLINLCNREMSKALTSQSLATEIIGGGSRAAAETHQGRTDNNSITDRELNAETYNELFAWMTEINFGSNVAPPKFSWQDKKERNKDEVEFFAAAAALVPIKKEDIYKALDISEPGDGDDVVFLEGKKLADAQAQPDADFAKHLDDFSPKDHAISDIVAQVKAAINKGETLDQALDNIVALIPELERHALDELVRNELELSFGTGMVEAD